jgi:uncharacterized protein YuzE
MKLTVDREADALYLDLDESPAAESEEISPGVILDYNAAGKVVGIEMLYLSKRVATEKLGRMQFETVGGGESVSAPLALHDKPVKKYRK